MWKNNLNIDCISFYYYQKSKFQLFTFQSIPLNYINLNLNEMN